MKLQLGHRARRFVWSLKPASISQTDMEWVGSLLSELELRAFNRMSLRDRAHSIGVARAVEANLVELEPALRDDWILRAALLHDVGKSAVTLGTYGRVVATLAGWIAGEDMGPVWAEKSGITRRIGLYLQHPRIGADMLRLAESDPRVIAWAAEHYRDEDKWTIPSDAGRLLVAADNGTLAKRSVT